MSERKLVTIRKISEIKPIPDADAIEIAIVDGWQCVVKKNTFKVGDFAFYFEIDSFLPTDREEFSFLKPANGKKTVYNGIEGHRLRTIKLRKQLSQGLLIPAENHLPLEGKSDKTIDSEDLNIDYSIDFGVQKWEAPIPAQLAGSVKSTFPSYIIPKTDQERIQNIIGDVYEEVMQVNTKFEVTLKLDGSSMTVYSYNDVIGVCSRNMELVENEDNTFWKTAKSSGSIEWLKRQGHNYAIQGELMGPGIQGNSENLKEHQFFVYDIYDIDEKRYLTSTERLSIWPFDHVPVYSTMKLFQGTFNEDKSTSSKKYLLEYLLDLAVGSSLNSSVREGLVFKSTFNPSFSFKVISNEFLLKEK
jgi:RNA ligase (TIGR02306 family)